MKTFTPTEKKIAWITEQRDWILRGSDLTPNDKSWLTWAATRLMELKTSFKMTTAKKLVITVNELL